MMAEKNSCPMVNINGEINIIRSDEFKKTMERYGLIYKDWSVVRVEPDRIYCLRRCEDNSKEVNMMVLPREVRADG